MALLLASSVLGARTDDTPETRTAAHMDRIATSPPLLRMFLQAMPKGGDLHNHLSGSVYAEDYLRWAGEADLCIAIDNNRIVRPPCRKRESVPARDLATRDHARYGKVIDTLSMRGLNQAAGDPVFPGHEHFFSTFEAFKPAFEGNTGKAIAAVRQDAADNHVAYLELMLTPTAVHQLLDAVGTMDVDGTDFAALSAALAPLIPAAVAEARADFDRYDKQVAALLGCGGTSPDPACEVEVRYQVPAVRTRPPAQVFTVLAFGFALVEADPRFVGVNIAGPEHHPVSARDYTLHMRMLAFLKNRHPTVPLSLHAGEQTLGLVAPRDLRSHIHDAVVIAGARRIGHGVDIAHETDAPALLKRMAETRIAVEINLSSNAAILGVKGKDHPLPVYREAGVPVVLSTDDPGILRSDMTHEYVRAVREQGLRYPDLKRIARDSLEYAFLPGASLWRSETGGAMVESCDASPPAPDAACARFLSDSPKARLQWRLERDFDKFELARFESEHP